MLMSRLIQSQLRAEGRSLSLELVEVCLVTVAQMHPEMKSMYLVATVVDHLRDPDLVQRLPQLSPSHQPRPIRLMRLGLAGVLSAALLWFYALYLLS